LIPIKYGHTIVHNDIYNYIILKLKGLT